MAKKEKFYLTKDGLTRLKKEYENLKNLKASKISGETPKILQSEDLNPEYLALQEDLIFLDTRLNELKNVLENAELITLPPKEKQNVVALGAKVSVDIDGETDEFKIVNTIEANPAENKISDQSPIGLALAGKRVGDLVEIKTPIVNHWCKIIRIKYEAV